MFKRQEFINYIQTNIFPDLCFYIDTESDIPILYNIKPEEKNVMISWFNENLDTHVEDQSDNIHELLSFKSNYEIFDKLMKKYPISIHVCDIENPKIIIGGIKQQNKAAKDELLIFIKDIIYVQEIVAYPLEKLLLIEKTFDKYVPSILTIDHSANLIEFNGRGRLVERLKFEIREFCKGMVDNSSIFIQIKVLSYQQVFIHKKENLTTLNFGIFSLRKGLYF